MTWCASWCDCSDVALSQLGIVWLRNIHSLVACVMPTALSWLHQPKASEGLPVEGVLLCGDSAGGNLALVLSMLITQGVDPDQRPDPKGSGMRALVKHSALLYPSLFQLDTTSARQDGMRYFLPCTMRRFYRVSYLGEDPKQRAQLLSDWRVAPLSTSSFEGLPAVSVISADLDPLRDESLLLVKRLLNDQVHAAHLHVPEAPHGFLTFPSWACDRVKCASALKFLEREIQASLAKPCYAVGIC